MLEEILKGRILTARCRDEINVQRHEIINNYSKENPEKGEFYYVYNKRSDGNYGVVIHKNGETGSSITLEESQLPDDVGVDCVLKLKNNEFILDKQATEFLRNQITEMVNKVLDEQSKRLEVQRIEGHLYEVVEISKNTVELIDLTDDNGECFEEINFPNDEFDKISSGTIFQYINGEYKLNK